MLSRCNYIPIQWVRMDPAQTLMMDYRPYLDWIDTQHRRMCGLVKTWAEINSGSYNLSGLAKMAAELKREFAVLGGEISELPLASVTSITADGRQIQTPLGRAISIRKRPDAPVKIFLGIHMDTVFGPDHPFQKVEQINDNTLRGPGVVDAKGGLCVMLIALLALERSPFAETIGWEVLINPDEEIASPGSAPLFVQAARRNQFGLLFEPALPDGNLVGERKGSANFTVIIHGKSAHAGRDFSQGRSAIHAAAAMVVMFDELNRTLPGVTVNVGRIDGGGPTNIVADLAVVRFNVRVPTRDDQQKAEQAVQQIVQTIGSRDGISLELSGSFLSPPKPMDAPTKKLMDQIITCGRELGMNLSWRSTGGVSDGNKLAAAGLPVVDSLGPRGGGLHSSEEFVLLDSMVERAKLAALVMMRSEGK
jgi:glutamate carboxypeptidase